MGKARRNKELQRAGRPAEAPDFQQKPEDREGWAYRFGWSVPLLLALLVNANVLLNDFTWDDKIFFVDSADQVQRPNGPASVPGLYFRPLIGWSYDLDKALWGLNPFGFHFSVYLAHALTTLMVYLCAVLLLRLYRQEEKIALLTASLFAVHPVHAEAVAWISGRNDVFMALFMMIALYAYLRYRRGAAAWIALPVFALGCSLALLSKETAIPFLLIFAVLDFLFHRSGLIRWRGIKDPLTWIWMIALVVFVLYRLSSVELPSAHRDGSASLGDEILTPVLTLGYYLKLLIIPYPLNAFVPRLPRGDFQSLIYLLTGTGGMAVLLWIFLRKIRTLYAVGAAWFVLGMAAPLMVPLAKVAVTPVAERYVYLASGGFLLMVSLGGYHGGRWIRSRWSVPIAVGGLAIVIGLFSVLTVDRNRIWRNEAVLWKDAVLKSPAAVLPHYNLGIAYRSIGRLEEAAEEFRTTLKLDPRYPLAHTNLGIVYKEMGRSEEAIQEYRGELELQSDQAEASYKAHNNLGIVYKDLGRYEEALQEFQTALLRQPNSFKPHFNLGAAYEEMGRLDEAIREYRAGLAINPKDAKAHINLGIVYANLGKFREAVAELKTVVRLKPDDASARVVLGDLYKELGRPEEAKAEYQHALRIKPDFDAARKALESLPKQK